MKSVEGWFAYAEWGNTCEYRKRLIDKMQFKDNC